MNLRQEVFEAITESAEIVNDAVRSGTHPHDAYVCGVRDGISMARLAASSVLRRRGYPAPKGPNG